MRAVAGIPARMGASRFPGKPLAKLLGMPMVEHVYKRTQLAKNLDDVFVATCDEVIRETVEAFGGRAYMTPPEIERPGLRVAEVCKQISLADDDIVVVVQGDEPLVHPDMIDLVIQELLDHPHVQLGTLVAATSEAEWLDADEVKVVADKHGDILYMSRSPIPSNTCHLVGPRFKQVAIMPFRKRFLLDFQSMSPTPLEIAESIELLRALEHGHKVRAIQSPYRSISVDTEAGRAEAEEALRSDAIFPLYALR